VARVAGRVMAAQQLHASLHAVARIAALQGAKRLLGKRKPSFRPKFTVVPYHNLLLGSGVE